MLVDGRCDLCGSDIKCMCGQYSSVRDRPIEKRIEAAIDYINLTIQNGQDNHWMHEVLKILEGK